MFIVAAEGDDNPYIPKEEYVPRIKAHLKEYPLRMVADRDRRNYRYFKGCIQSIKNTDDAGSLV
jgi:hypothetical protein